MTDERHIVVSYEPGTPNVRAMRPDQTSAREDADALRRAATVVDEWASRDERPGGVCAAPAEPDAGDVEVREWLMQIVGEAMMLEPEPDADTITDAILASGWLDAVRRKAEAQALTDAADAMRPPVAGIQQWLRDRATRIARESR